MYFIWENEIRGVFFYLNPSINEPLYYYESHLSANLATVDIDAAVKGTGADVIDGALQAEAESGRGGAGIRFYLSPPFLRDGKTLQPVTAWQVK